MPNIAQPISLKFGYAGHAITLGLKWLPSDNLYAVQSHIEGELFAHDERDGSVAKIIGALVADAIGEIHRIDGTEYPVGA